MFEVDKNLQIVILIFIGTIFILFKQKPEIMFKNNKKPKEFGSGKDKTIVPVWLVAISISLLFYVRFTLKKDDFV